MKDLLLKASELQSLMKYVGQLPTDYGMPIKIFFSDIERLRNQEQKTSEQVSENVTEEAAT